MMSLRRQFSPQCGENWDYIFSLKIDDRESLIVGNFFSLCPGEFDCLSNW